MFIPFGDRLLIEQLKKKAISELIIPDGEENFRLPCGKVLAIGEKVEERLLKVGDRVYFNDFAGERIKVGGNEHYLIRVSECLGKEGCVT